MRFSREARLTMLTFVVATLCSLIVVNSLSSPTTTTIKDTISSSISRRSVLFAPPKQAAIASFVTFTALLPFESSLAATTSPSMLNLTMQTTASGLQWADAQVGTGQAFRMGDAVCIDYDMATKDWAAGRVVPTSSDPSWGGVEREVLGSIHNTENEGTPYQWKLGDRSTIAGLEQAILGSADDNMPPMLPGGVRRVIIPSALGYQSMVSNNKPQDLGRICTKDREGSLSPIPTKYVGDSYRKWVQFYCNKDLPNQPDLLMDLKLYGAR